MLHSEGDQLFVMFVRKVGKENVHTALSLVGYDEELEAAMAYIFGSTLVCRSMNDAKKVYYKMLSSYVTLSIPGFITK